MSTHSTKEDCVLKLKQEEKSLCYEEVQAFCSSSLKTTAILLQRSNAALEKYGMVGLNVYDDSRS